MLHAVLPANTIHIKNITRS